MSAEGLSLGAAIATAVLAASLVVLLYQIRERRTRVVVTFGALIRAAAGPANSRRRERVRRGVSIAMQLVIVTLLVALMLEPAALRAPATTSHLVVLFDTSASMMAREGDTTRFELARQALLRHLAALPDATDVLLLTTDAQTIPVMPWARDRGSLARALGGIKPSEASSNFKLGLTSAAQYLAEQPRGRLLVVTDGTISDWGALVAEPSLANVPIECITVGTDAFNVGITNVAARLQRNSPRFSDLLVELVNADLAPHETSLEITSRGQRVATRSLRLDAQQQRTIQLTDLEVRHHVFEVHVRVPAHARDALPLDDNAYAVLPQAAKTRVAVLTRGNLYLEAAVLADDFLEAHFLAPDAVLDPSDIDAAIYDGVEPPIPLTVPSLIVNPPVGSTRVQVGATITQAGFDSWDKSSSWLRDLDLYDIQINRGHALLPAADDEVLAYSGKHPLLLAGRREGVTFVAIGFDISQSDFVLRPIWPLFVRQVLEQLLGQRVAEVRETRPLQAIRMPAEMQTGKLQILAQNSGHDRTVAADRPWWLVPANVGLVETLTDRKRGFVAVNLSSASESRIRTLRPLTYQGRPVPSAYQPLKVVTRPLASGLASLLLFLLALEWFTFHRRWTL